MGQTLNENKSADWLGSLRTSAIAWWIPQGVMVAAFFAPVSVRTWIWAAVLLWMGVACILNSRRCGRVHCRYTGPYYLAMIVPVLALGLGAVPAGNFGWLALGIFILGGGKAIWWLTERRWGKFRAA